MKYRVLVRYMFSLTDIKGPSQVPCCPKFLPNGRVDFMTPECEREKGQTACKPGSVPMASRRMGGDHSSGTAVTGRLERSTRTTPRGRGPCRPYSILLPVGFTLPAPLPVRRCALTAPFHPYPRTAEAAGGRFAFCGTFPGVASAGRYPAPYPRGARTFLSAAQGATKRPPGRLTAGRGGAFCAGRQVSLADGGRMRQCPR